MSEWTRVDRCKPFCGEVVACLVNDGDSVKIEILKYNGDGFFSCIYHEDTTIKTPVTHWIPFHRVDFPEPPKN